MTDQRIDVSTLPDSQLRAAVESYGAESICGAMAAEVLRLRGVLAVIEGATRANEPGRAQRSLATVRAALNMVDR